MTKIGMKVVDEYLAAMAAADEAGDHKEAHACEDMAFIAFVSKIADGPDSQAQRQASAFWSYLIRYHRDFAEKREYEEKGL